MRFSRLLVVALVAALILGSMGLGVTQAQDESEAAWLGVAVRDSDEGAVVAEVVDDSPAADAGIQVEDVITAVDETTIEGAAELVDAVAEYAPGDTATVAVQRAGEELSFDVTFGTRPEDIGGMPDDMDIVPPMMGRMNLLGVELDLTEDGLRIVSIDSESPLAESGLQEGDLVTAIDGEPVGDLLPRELLQALDGVDEVTLTVQRDGEEVEVVIDVSEFLGAFDVPFSFGQPQAAPRPTQLGIQFTTLDADSAAEMGLEVEEGALVVEVFEDTPAAEAGLQADDVITAVDGDMVDQERLLTDRLYAYEEGDVVTLTVLRDGEEIELEVTLGPSNAGMFVPRGMPYGGRQFDDGRPGQRGRGRQGFGQGHMREMMPFFFMHPEMGRFFDKEFLEQHPFMGEMFENMPEDGFHFFFGPSDDMPDDSEPAPETDAAPDVSSTAA